MNKEHLLQAVKEAGIVGEGGAGFPAHVKFAAAPDTLIANGCECEPLLHTDLHLMVHHAHEFCAGFAVLKETLGAKRALIAVKRKNKTALVALRDAMGSLPLEIVELDDFYPAGDEQTLVYELLGRSVPPLGLPIQVGVVVSNVGSIINVARAVGAHGKNPEPVTHKIVTVTGEVEKPRVIRVPLGTPLTTCLSACGGTKVADPVYIIGGPMMGRVVDDATTFAGEVVTKTVGGLIVLPRGHYLHNNARLGEKTMRRQTASACIQCRSCSDLCPRTLIGHPFQTHQIMRAFGAGAELSAEVACTAHMCCECGICEHYACPMELSPRRINQRVKALLREQGKTYQGTKDIVPENTLWRSYRKIPVSRLAARIGLAPYMALETPFLGDVASKEVHIPLRQHIGAPSIATVKVGDTVTCGAIIGVIPEKALGAQIHASIAGTITKVSDVITITADEGR